MRNISGSSSRKASWPLSLSTSTKETLAAAAFSACTIVAALARREQPVAGEGHQAEARRRAPEGVGQHAAMRAREVEIVHRARDVEVAVGVEAIDEGRALVAQVALDLEVGVEAEAQRIAVLQGAAELALQRLLREIGDVRGHARHREAARRHWSGAGGSRRPSIRDRP